jgi:Cu/Ag efflux pump CusA
METVENTHGRDIRTIYFWSAKRLRQRMTVSVALFGLVPILWSTGTGADVMIPITVPLIGTNHFNYLCIISNAIVSK